MHWIFQKGCHVDCLAVTHKSERPVTWVYMKYLSVKLDLRMCNNTKIWLTFKVVIKHTIPKNFATPFPVNFEWLVMIVIIIDTEHVWQFWVSLAFMVIWTSLVSNMKSIIQNINSNTICRSTNYNAYVFAQYSLVWPAFMILTLRRRAYLLIRTNFQI